MNEKKYLLDKLSNLSRDCYDNKLSYDEYRKLRCQYLNELVIIMSQNEMPKHASSFSETDTVRNYIAK